MKRTPLKRKTPLRPRRIRTDGPAVEREPHPRAPVSVQPRPGVSYGGSTTGPVVKTVAYRDRALLDMAQGRPCLLMVPGVCSHRVDTVVAAHSNLSCHGKGGARKADDVYTVAACHACHTWLDQGSASAKQKEAVFMAGHALQVLAWRNIAVASDEPERFRKAARRALDHLNATPIGEMPC